MRCLRLALGGRLHRGDPHEFSSSSRASATISRVGLEVIVAFEYAAAASPRAIAEA